MRGQWPIGALVTAALVTASVTMGVASMTERASAAPVPCRAITRGPRHHWFGYYDKLEFDPTGRYVLGMAVDFEGRSPRADDAIEIGMVDLADNDRWVRLGESRAWGWQQGCMLQWRPGSRSEVLWNDREGDRFVCRIVDTATRRSRAIAWPIYTVSPDGRTGLSVDFRRIQDMRPGYGYATSGWLKGIRDVLEQALVVGGSLGRVALDNLAVPVDQEFLKIPLDIAGKFAL